MNKEEFDDRFGKTVTHFVSTITSICYKALENNTYSVNPSTLEIAIVSETGDTIYVEDSYSDIVVSVNKRITNLNSLYFSLDYYTTTQFSVGEYSKQESLTIPERFWTDKNILGKMRKKYLDIIEKKKEEDRLLRQEIERRNTIEKYEQFVDAFEEFKILFV